MGITVIPLVRLKDIGMEEIRHRYREPDNPRQLEPISKQVEQFSDVFRAQDQALSVAMPKFDHLGKFFKQVEQFSDVFRAQDQALSVAMPKFDHLGKFFKQVEQFSDVFRAQDQALSVAMPKFDHLGKFFKQVEQFSDVFNVAASAAVASRLFPQMETVPDLRTYSAGADPSVESCVEVGSQWLNPNHAEVFVDPLDIPSDDQIQWTNIANFVIARILACLLFMMMCADIGLQTRVTPLDDSFVTSETILSGISHTIHNDESLPVYLFWLPLALYLYKKREGG